MKSKAISYMFLVSTLPLDDQSFNFNSFCFFLNNNLPMKIQEAIYIRTKFDCSVRTYGVVFVGTVERIVCSMLLSE